MEKLNPVLTLSNTIFAEMTLPSCYIPLYLPIFRNLAFSDDHTLYGEAIALLDAFANSEDEYKETVLRFARCDVNEILLELLRVAPHLNPSPESVLMSFCDAEPALQPREVLLLIGDRGMLSESEDVRMNSILNLDQLDPTKCNPLYVVCVDDMDFEDVYKG